MPRAQGKSSRLNLIETIGLKKREFLLEVEQKAAAAD